MQRTLCCIALPASVLWNALQGHDCSATQGPTAIHPSTPCSTPLPPPPRCPTPSLSPPLHRHHLLHVSLQDEDEEEIEYLEEGDLGFDPDEEEDLEDYSGEEGSGSEGGWAHRSAHSSLKEAAPGRAPGAVHCGFLCSRRAAAAALAASGAWSVWGLAAGGARSALGRSGREALSRLPWPAPLATRASPAG